MRVLLIHPPSSFLLSSNTFPPLGLLYLAGALRRGGHEALVADMGCGDSLAGYEPLGAIGITATTAQLPYLRGIVEQCRQLYPAVPILLGGPHVTCSYNDPPKWNVEGAGVGECEEVICYAVEVLKFGEWNGLHYSPNYQANIHRVGLPDRDAIDLHKYKYTLASQKATTLITQRGCPYSCHFCSRTVGQGVVRLRTVEAIEEELRDIQRRGFNAVVFYDDEFNVYHRHAVEVAEVLGKLGMAWRAFIRTNLFSEAQAEVFSENGCVELCAGVESGSKKILRMMEKNATPEQNSRARERCAKHGIRFKAFTMIGLPWEDYATVEATRQWLLDNRPDDFDICIFQPYPGTKIVQHPERYDIEFDLDYLTNPVWHKGTPGEYKTTVRTKALSSDELIRLRDSIELEVREELGLAKLGGKV